MISQFLITLLVPAFCYVYIISKNDAKDSLTILSLLLVFFNGWLLWLILGSNSKIETPEVLVYGLLVSDMLGAFLAYGAYAEIKNNKILEKKDQNYLASLSEAQRSEVMITRLTAEVEALEVQKNTILGQEYGAIESKLICPHCHSNNSVRKKELIRVIETRVNSIPARVIGLGTNTNKKVNQLHCDICDMTWDV